MKYNNSPPCVIAKWCEVQIPPINFLESDALLKHLLIDLSMKFYENLCFSIKL